MEFWFSELHTGNVKLSIKIEKQLFSGESEYQRIDVFDSEEFGKFIALDGEIVFSEKDEFIYDEMVTHVPMAVHPCVKDVLIIGGGDGGVAKELLQYDCVEHIDVVETDEMFVEVSRKFFPEVACALDDPRVEVHYDDGLRFLRNKKAKYDLIINDSTENYRHYLKVRFILQQLQMVQRAELVYFAPPRPHIIIQIIAPLVRVVETDFYLYGVFVFFCVLDNARYH